MDESDTGRILYIFVSSEPSSDGEALHMEVRFAGPWDGRRFPRFTPGVDKIRARMGSHWGCEWRDKEQLVSLCKS